MYYLKLLLFFTSLFFLLHGCTKEAVRPPEFPQEKIIHQLSSDNMVLLDQPVSEILNGDDLSNRSLEKAIEQSLVYLNRVPSSTVYRYGKLRYTAKELIKSFQIFSELLGANLEEEEFLQRLDENFHVFHSAANPGEKVLYTGYYEPIFKGSLTPDSEYNVPVYRKPDDLKILRLGKFRRSLRNRTIVYRQDGEKVLPYFSREKIVDDNVLANKNYELAWMKDPIDLFFLQIQGSGILQLPSGKRVKLGYVCGNGHNYSSIGKLLYEEGKMELEKISMQSIREYLNNHPDDRDRILNHNKSYTFFSLEQENVEENPRGNINVPLTPRRSVATDSGIFPKGGLAYIKTEVPVFDENWDATGTKEISRFVLNQDTGGAIKGPGRVDIFWGNGDLAERSAGKLRSFGKIYFLVAKKKALNKVFALR